MFAAPTFNTETSKPAMLAGLDMRAITIKTITG